MYTKSEKECLSIVVITCEAAGEIGAECIAVSAWGCPIDGEYVTNTLWIVPGTIKEKEQ